MREKVWINHLVPSVLSCRSLHEHGQFETSWRWNSDAPLEVNVDMILPEGAVSDVPWESLKLTVARELVWDTVQPWTNPDGDEYAVHGTPGYVTMKVRRTMPNVVVIVYEHGIFMVQRHKIVAFLMKTYQFVPETEECNVLDLDRLAARLQYS